ncbi:MAG: pyridoxal-phosphate dependent enzyme, partial [Phaeodactylibacter sp.]|nr:pyridoxal-phosphate dependent enzyme [Phaeodactylibacter sp.]
MLTPIQELESSLLHEQAVRVWVKRDDLTDPLISGNKWRKLRYNIEAICATEHRRALTFGGAFSNHIAAVAAAGHRYRFTTIGLIRGDRPKQLNPTLQLAADQGMELHFIDRQQYRNKEALLSHWQERAAPFFVIPEGGSNTLALRGAAEVIPELNRQMNPMPEIICLSAGTGGTAAGLLAALEGSSRVEVFPALKGDFLGEVIEQLVESYKGLKPRNWELITDYHFGGYAKFSPELIQFINAFKQAQGIELDPIYTGKLFFAVFDRIRKGIYPPGSRVLI